MPNSTHVSQFRDYVDVMRVSGQAVAMQDGRVLGVAQQNYLVLYRHDLNEYKLLIYAV